jgi:O-antigen biosynthesis protein WbqP
MNGNNWMLKRIFDILISGALLFILSPLFFLCAILVRLSSTGPVFHVSKRVGRWNKFFLMPKFRSMHVSAPQVASHLIQDPDTHLTPVGRFLRRTSLDELPQLWSVLVGDMSLVGPRPALFNQDDLVFERTKLGIHVLRPGITGWAQVNGRDEIPLERKVELDHQYLRNSTFLFDLKILLLTLWKISQSEGVSH